MSRRGIEEKVGNGTVLDAQDKEKLLRLSNKASRKRNHDSKLIAKYSSGLDYIRIYRNGQLYIESNVLPQGIYDDDITPEMIIEMFKRRIKPGY